MQNLPKRFIRPKISRPIDRQKGSVSPAVAISLAALVVLAAAIVASVWSPTFSQSSYDQATKRLVTLSLDEEYEHDFGKVNDARIIAYKDEPGSWLAHGLSYDERRYSHLDQINRDTVNELGLAWFIDTGSTRAQESTPIIVDGVMYYTSTWSRVYAVDAKTGAPLWQYDPQVPGEWARRLCCDVVNRGVAVYEGRVFVGTLDGRLIALDAQRGTVEWEVDTLVDRDRFYSITGAPRVAKGKVYIGNGGSEYGVRGYVSAFDAATGDLVWRFFTVPGDPGEPYEHPELEAAAETWTGDQYWNYGGGGTVWNAIVYDVALDQLYIGVGNGSPWSRSIRSTGWRGQSLPVFDCGAEPRYGPENLALSDNASRKLGLHRYPGHYVG